MAVPLWAGKYIGLPFLEKGRTADGADCWGLVRIIYLDEFGIYLPSYVESYKDTSDAAEIGHLFRSQSPRWLKIQPGEEQPGDVIVLRMHGQPMHVGVVVGDKQFLHVTKHVDGVLEKYRSMVWAGRVLGFYRHKEMDEVLNG